ncbi:hypothetical protein VTJ04DRAFT_1314 [Mycothermus thermophilus]|uniref:uncharacterized protein n=1 Tax=Humicola insolens TaxID=85995 RepID=UPI00374288DD
MTFFRNGLGSARCCVNQQSTQQIQIPPYGFYSAPSALTSSLSPLEAVSTPPPPPPPPPPSSEPEYLSSAKTAQKLRKLLQAVPELDPRLYNVGEVTNPGGPEGEGEREGGRRREPDEPPLRGNTPSTPPSHVPAEYRHLHHHPPPPPNRDPAATMLLKPRREISEEQVRRSNDLHVALSDNFKGLVGGFKTLWEKPS